MTSAGDYVTSIPLKGFKENGLLGELCIVGNNCIEADCIYRQHQGRIREEGMQQSTSKN